MEMVPSMSSIMEIEAPEKREQSYHYKSILIVQHSSSVKKLNLVLLDGCNQLIWKLNAISDVAQDYRQNEKIGILSFTIDIFLHMLHRRLKYFLNWKQYIPYQMPSSVALVTFYAYMSFHAGVSRHDSLRQSNREGILSVATLWIEWNKLLSCMIRRKNTLFERGS